MHHDKRHSYRCNVSRETAHAELVVDNCARKVQLLNESVGGYLARQKGKSNLKVDAVGLLKTAGGWYNVKIVRRSETDDGTLLGLLRIGIYQPPAKPSDVISVWRSALGVACCRTGQRTGKPGNLLVFMGLGSVALLAVTFVIYMARPSLFRPARAAVHNAGSIDLAGAADVLGEAKPGNTAAHSGASHAGGTTGTTGGAAVKKGENFAAQTLAPVVEKAVETTVQGVAKVANDVADLAAAPTFDPRSFGPLRRLDLLTSADLIKRLGLIDVQSQRIHQIQTQSLRDIEQLRKQTGLAQDQFNKQAQAVAEQAEQAAHRVLSADQREKFINFYGPSK